MSDPSRDDRQEDRQKPSEQHASTPRDPSASADRDDQLEGEGEGGPLQELEKAEEAMEALEGERDKLFERLQRVSADYQNYMRRAEQELGRAIDHARGDLLRKFLPVLDHFDSALANVPESEDGRQLYEGVKIVRDELLKVLQQTGVQRLDVEVGQPFDPHRHEALMQQEVEGVEPGCVAAIMQPGYVHGERTLRPAKVAVTPSG